MGSVRSNASSIKSSVSTTREAKVAEQAELKAELSQLEETERIKTEEMKIEQELQQMKLRMKLRKERHEIQTKLLMAEAAMRAIDDLYKEYEEDDDIINESNDEISNPEVAVTSTELPHNITASVDSSVKLHHTVAFPVVPSNLLHHTVPSATGPSVHHDNLNTDRNRPQSTKSTVSKDVQVIADTLANHQQRLVEMLQAPQTDIEPFNGDPLKFHPFMKTFDNAVDATSLSDCAKLTRLGKYCTGRPHKAIESCMSMEPSVGYKEARNLLKERFGDKYNITKSWLDKILIVNNSEPMTQKPYKTSPMTSETATEV